MSKTIMIMGAMEDVELNVLLENLTDIEIYNESNYRFYKGKLMDNTIILSCTKVGTVNATLATQIGILKFNPNIIIGQGIAGGHGYNVHTNDIVVGNEIININTIETVKKGKGQGSNSLEWQLNNFENNVDESLIIEKSSEILLENAKKVNYDYGNVVFGRIGSGDVWNKETDRILMFNEKYETLCEEMEGYAIAKVANLYNIPMIIIRAISNNEILNERYQRKVGKYAQEFTLEFLKNIFCYENII